MRLKVFLELISCFRSRARYYFWIIGYEDNPFSFGIIMWTNKGNTVNSDVMLSVVLLNRKLAILFKLCSFPESSHSLTLAGHTRNYLKTQLRALCVPLTDQTQFHSYSIISLQWLAFQLVLKLQIALLTLYLKMNCFC